MSAVTVFDPSAQITVVGCPSPTVGTEVLALHFGLGDDFLYSLTLRGGLVQDSADEDLEGVVIAFLKRSPSPFDWSLRLNHASWYTVAPHDRANCPLVADHDERVVVDRDERVPREGEPLVRSLSGFPVCLQRVLVLIQAKRSVRRGSRSRLQSLRRQSARRA